jgi:uncharacterized protein YndB with AHSA1/START domain
MTSQPACLVIADISGYTSYLQGVELDHAQDILADLMNTVVKALRPLRLAKLEGDGAFVYSLTDAVDGSVLLDSMEGCYFAFRQRLMSIRQATTCECNACMTLPRLNLKLVAHHGQVVLQKVAGRSELVGNDVILVHRLLKNSLALPAYVFITDQCVAQTELNPEALGFSRHIESYEHVGEVRGWVEDLEAAWTEHQERNRQYVSKDDAAFELSGFVPASPETVWEYISSPTLRPQWSMGMTSIDQIDQSGRRRPGTLNHCMHGKDMILQEFVDWNPPRYYTSLATLGGVKLFSTHEVEPVEGGSIVHDRFRRPKDKASREFFEGFKEAWKEGHTEELARLIELVVAHESSKAEDDEPELPAPNEAARLATTVSGT